MASASSPPPLRLAQRLDLDAVRSLVSSVNRHVHRFLSDAAARKSLQLRCGRALAVSHQAFFEFSEHSVLSNLYWGIENIEVALQCQCRDGWTQRLAASEKMLQMPALLDEVGSTAGVENRYLVCCSYFYLALVWKLRRDEWQMMMHLLQSLLVSPNCFRKELAPGLWRSLFGSLTSRTEDEEEAEEIARQHVRRYKDWLMYYQVVSYGETPPWNKERSGADHGERKAENYQYRGSASTRCFNSIKRVTSWSNFQNANMVYQLNLEDNIEVNIEASASISDEREIFTERKDENYTPLNLDMSFPGGIKESFDIRCLQEMLEESQSDSPVSFYSHIGSADEESDSEVRMQHTECPADIPSIDVGPLASIGQRNCRAQCSPSEHVDTYFLESPVYPVDKEDYEANASFQSSRRSQSSLSNLKFSVLDVKEMETHPFCNYYVKEMSPGRSPKHDLRCFSTFSARLRKRYNLSELVSRGSYARRRRNFPTSEKDWSDGSSNYGKDSQVELLGIFEKAVSTICFPEGRGNREDADLEVTTIWELLKKQNEVKHSVTKQQILDQLLEIVSASKKEKIIRESVSILLLLISEDKTIIQDIKKKDLHLYYLASALKRNVHEAAILIYLLNPSPSEIRSLELLPALVEVACSPDGHNKKSIVLPLTPSSASIAMIEILVTAFDYVTNNMHLAAISSPQILSKLVNAAMHENLEEGVALAAILVRCMRLNGNCKKFLSQFTPVEPFLHLLRSNEKHAKFAALEYFHEILQIPRSSAIRLLHQIRQHKSIGIMHSLMACIRQTELEHQLMAANLLLQLDMLRVSCVHTQILEVGQVGSGAATALIFCKGLLCVGHSDGSIKVWDIKGQKSMLLSEAKEHKRAITCFALSESGDGILSGSSDKTVRIWKMVQKKLECVEVIEMKEPIQKLETYGGKILVITRSRGLKVCQASRSIQTLCKNKHIKCLVMARDKAYLGCVDSSIQEVDLMDGNKTLIRAPAYSWRIQKKPVNSIKLYKDWVYSAGAVVEGSCLKDWRKHRQPQILMNMTRRTSVQSMEVVEDFIYLNCSSSRSVVQIWLRGQQQKVGRLSTGGKVTSLLAANDIIFCGTENGLTKTPGGGGRGRRPPKYKTWLQRGSMTRWSRAEAAAVAEQAVSFKELEVSASCLASFFEIKEKFYGKFMLSICLLYVPDFIFSFCDAINILHL
ncbi:WD domain, G-beta repeat [Musa troglodytarum]|uniref:WD domain, G-beta repeat n=1 Tax=Musa troglodytarum TaxID=320322 RepID=A0A9E7L2Y5_9LILI|nr:WD domain, G-beta repeat [Musa troglodytarum]